LSLSRLLCLSLFRPNHETWKGTKSGNWPEISFYLCRSNPFAWNERLSGRPGEKLRFFLSRSNPFARTEVRSSKTEAKMPISLPGATLSHDMRVDRHKLKQNNEFTCPGATLSHEMIVYRQNLRQNCDFAQNDGRSAKTEVKLPFFFSWKQPARNQVRSSKTEVTFVISLLLEQPFRSWGENASLFVPEGTLSHELRSISENQGKNAILRVCV
jgi:hypothetical protein